MDAQKFRGDLSTILKGHPEADAQVIIVVVFSDGYFHVTPVDTIDVGEKSIQYTDVHCDRRSPKINVEYGRMMQVLDFAKIKLPTLDFIPPRIIDAEFTVLNPNP